MRVSDSEATPKESVGPEQRFPTPAAQLQGALDKGEDFLLATGRHARQVSADLVELRERRLEAAGGCVFKRGRSRCWQMKYLFNGKFRYQSTGVKNTGVKSRREAERILAWKVHQASAGLLPGTASFEQIIANLVEDAKVRGLKALKRIERAGRALCAQLEGHRAEQIGRALWVKYAAQRQEQVAIDTVHFELTVARRAYRLARANGVVRSIPDFPQIKNLRVRQGFLDPRDWARVGEQLRADFRDAAEFAFLCGAREMETLTLQWPDIEPEPRVIHLRETKTGVPRKVDYAQWPELAGVIERRAAVDEQLRRAGVITPWVFCFSQAVVVRGRQYHATGAPLFKQSGERGLLAALRDEWAAACRRAGLPGLLFHDLRRSACRNMDRGGVPRGVAMKLGGWSDRMYSRYDIGAESELAAAGAALSDYLRRCGWHSVGTGAKKPIKSNEISAEGGRSRTFHRKKSPQNQGSRGRK